MQNLKFYLPIFILLIAFNMASCGQTGDLYLPEGEPEETIKNRSKN